MRLLVTLALISGCGYADAKEGSLTLARIGVGDAWHIAATQYPFGGVDGEGCRVRISDTQEVEIRNIAAAGSVAGDKLLDPDTIIELTVYTLDGSILRFGGWSEVFFEDGTSRALSKQQYNRVIDIADKQSMKAGCY